MFSSHSNDGRVMVLFSLFIDTIFFLPWFFVSFCFPFPSIKIKLILNAELLAMVFNAKWQSIQIVSSPTNQCRWVHDWSSHCNQYRLWTKPQLCHNLFGTWNWIFSSGFYLLGKKVWDWIQIHKKSFNQ